MHWESGIVRVFRPTDDPDVAQWVGNGFVFVTGDDTFQPLVATCAHVVAQALGDPELAFAETAPKGQFLIDYPNTTNRKLYRAEVIAEDDRAWLPQARDLGTVRGLQDFALLSVVQVGMPFDLNPLRLVGEAETMRPDALSTVLSYGRTSRHSDWARASGRLSDGRLQGQVSNAFWQFRSHDPADPAFVVRGYSGGPLYSPDLDAALGMVTLADTGKGLSWASQSARILAHLRGRRAPDADISEGARPSARAPARPAIPIDLRPPRTRAQVPRPAMQDRLRNRLDHTSLLYVHGRRDSGKSTEVLRLIEDKAAPVRAEATLWYHIFDDTSFEELATVVTRDCLNLAQAASLGPRELLRTLHSTDTYLVLDGYLDTGDAGLRRLYEMAALLNPPTRVIVTTLLSPERREVAECAVEVPEIDPSDLERFCRDRRLELPREMADTAAIGGLTGSLVARTVETLQSMVSAGHDDPPAPDEYRPIDIAALSPSRKALLARLSLIRGGADADMIARLIDAGDASATVETFLAEGVLRAVDARRHAVSELVSAPILQAMSAQEIAAAHIRVGEAMADRVAGLDRFELTRAPAALDLGYQAVRHLQAGGSPTEARRGLIDEIRAPLARLGYHKRLLELLETEYDLDPDIDPWLSIQMIQSAIALGRTRRAFAEIRRARPLILRAAAADATILMAYCNQIGALLSLVDQNELAARILETVQRGTRRARVTPTVRKISRSLRAWCRGLAGAHGEAIETLQALLEEGRREAPANAIGAGVAETRLGVLRGLQGETDAALAHLRAGITAFEDTDLRGEVWALSHYCHLALERNKLDLPIRELERLLDLQSAYGIVGEETYVHLSHFENALRGHPLHEQVLAVLEAFKSNLTDRYLLERDIEYLEAFDAYLHAFLAPPWSAGLGPIDEVVLDVLEGVSLRDETNRDRLLRLLGVVEKDLPQSEVVGTPILSRIAMTALLTVGDEARIDAFLAAFGPAIAAADLRTRLNFASFCERVGRPVNGAAFLHDARTTGSFRAQNILANCYANESFERAMDHNYSALALAKSPDQRARILNNMAMLILRHGRIDLLERAEHYLRECDKVRPERFLWPLRTALALDVSRAQAAELDQLVERAAGQGLLTPDGARYVSELVFDRANRARFDALAAPWAAPA